MVVIKSSFPSVEVFNGLFHEKILAALEQHTKARPDKIALIHAENPNEKLTYGQLRQQSLAVASFLSKHGLGYQDVICQVLPNCLEYAIGALAALSCGAAMSGASAMFTDYELERQFIDSKCKIVITDGLHLEKVIKAVKNCPLVRLIICIRPIVGHLPANVAAWSDALKDGRPPPPFRRNPEDLALLPYSSGTTGSPKGVMLTNSSFGTMIDIFVKYMNHTAVPHLKGGESWNWYDKNMLLMLPFYHIYGFAVLCKILINGATGVIMVKFDPILFLSSIEKYKIEILTVVPPIVLLMIRHPAAAKYDLSSLQMLLCGAAPLSKEVAEEFLNRYKHVRYLVQGYGMTEVSMASNLSIFDRRDNYVSVGHVVANTELKIIDPNTGKEQPLGERGELCIRGPTLMKGYLNRPEATAETIDKNGWLHTGDVAYVNEKGETFIVDRIKELIKVKGLQVPPAELEDLLHGHPDIADVAVIGLPDSRTGEKPKAFVVKANPRLTEQEVIQFVESKVSSYKWLTGGVEFVQEIPKSPSGKILRRFLRDKVVQSKI